MTSEKITEQLERIAESGDFPADAYEAAETWDSEKVGVESVDPILHFMELHPTIDFGTPGPLVHFVEKFYGQGYEGKLVESIQRHPTNHTVWMLNRLINGTKEAAKRHSYVLLLQQTR